uniref:inositol polyphosphate 5-phosphatase K-like isoform X3 n=2 Tax=Vespula vulgaris TaxID=7454 RepID=UPI00223B72BD|nr:inositol polyphosphate 5-phosphatase K-like isoform X3 [Vespula vulgaris]
MWKFKIFARYIFYWTTGSKGTTSEHGIRYFFSRGSMDQIIQRSIKRLRLCENPFSTVTGSCFKYVLFKKTYYSFKIGRSTIYENRIWWNGNKGAVSIRLNIYGVSICVVNTHLTPHDHLLTDRIADYNTILREHSFSAPDTSNILFHDYVFWIGDLNFRLHGEDLTAIDIDLLVKKNQLNLLLERDQLKLVMRNGDAFAELNENVIEFPPTYKFEFASQEFDLKRRPSWTDRILYKVNADVYDDVTLSALQLNYKSHSNYIQSDHKPVTGEFDIMIRPNVEDHGVEFQPVSAWFIDEENSVSYKLIGDVRPVSGDWVGLFHNQFSSLDEYIVYEYVVRGRTTETSGVESSEPITERIFFSDSALRIPGMYRLVYVAQRGDLKGILGMSPPFPGHRRPL